MMNQTQLFDSHKRLAYKIANEMARKFKHVEPDDFRQVSLQALWESAGRFDPLKGNKFSTFATTWCVGRCKNHVRERGDLVKGKTTDFWKVPRIERVEAPQSLESESGNPNDNFLERLLAEKSTTPLDILLAREENEQLQEILDKLPWECAFSIERYFLFGDSVELIGGKLGCSGTTVRSWISAASVHFRISRESIHCNSPRTVVRKERELRDDQGQEDGRAFGKRNGKCKLSDSQVRDLLALKGTMTATKAAKIFGVSQATVSNIWLGKTRLRVQNEPWERQELHGKSKLTYNQLIELQSLKGTMTQKAAGERYGITQSVVGKIWAGKAHRRVYELT